MNCPQSNAYDLNEIQASPKKLHLGSGVDYKKGWVNVDLGNKDDYGRNIRTEVNWNLNQFPYPFRDNQFEEVYMNQVLEHLDNPNKVIKEIVRICKNKAKVTIQVPHFSHYTAYIDYTHKHYFSLFSIDLMTNGCEIVSKEYDISDNKWVKAIGKLITANPRIYERFLYGYFPVMGIKWVLKVRK